MPGRTDNATNPRLAAQLLTARRGQAYFARKVTELPDANFDGPSLLPGWDRRHVVAHVGLNARALTHLTEWAATGEEHPMYESPTQRKDEIELTSTLPVQALRNLSDHAAIHLSVEWRDLRADAWSHKVRTAQGRLVPVSETVWMRTREVWIHAVDLANGGSFLDFPPELVDALLTDISGVWAQRREADGLSPFLLRPTDRPLAEADRAMPEGALVIHGTAARLAQWASGRGNVGVTISDGYPAPEPPRWL
jgi:maleylpyruvate isomerase